MTLLTRIIAPDRRVKREKVAADFSLGMMLGDCAAAIHSLSRACALLYPVLHAGTDCTSAALTKAARNANVSVAYAIRSLCRAYSHYRELGAAFDKTTSLGFLTRLVNKRHLTLDARQKVPHIPTDVHDDLAYGLIQAKDAAHALADAAADFARCIHRPGTTVEEAALGILNALGLAAIANEAMSEALCEEN